MTTDSKSKIAFLFTQASDRFFDLAHNSPSHFGASYSSSDSYHDWFFSLGTARELEVILAITVHGDCCMSLDDPRSYFEGRIRLLGRPADAGDDGEFSHDIRIDPFGLYSISSNSGRTPLNMTTFNSALVSEHFSKLSATFDASNFRDVIQKIIHHEQVRLMNMAQEAGAPLRHRRFANFQQSDGGATSAKHSNIFVVILDDAWYNACTHIGAFDEQQKNHSHAITRIHNGTVC